MRNCTIPVSFVLCAFFVPIFAHAAVTLVTYTVSNSTIYPTATADSGLATSTVVDLKFSERVKASVKILFADGGVANNFYSSTGVTDPNPRTWGGTNDEGTILSAGTYTISIAATSTTDANLILRDSSKTIVIASPATPAVLPETSDSSDTLSDAIPSVGFFVGSGTPEYLPLPALHIITDGNRNVSSLADTIFAAVIYDGKGNKRDDAIVTWTFGDGMKRTGTNVFHAYYEPGEYLAVVHATTDDGGDASKEMIVTVKNAGIIISSVSSRGIALSNPSDQVLDISLWWLAVGDNKYQIPENTKLLPNRTVLFPARVTGLQTTDAASLLYPSGETAATYPLQAVSIFSSEEKLLAPQKSINSIQKVEIISSIKTTGENDGEKVSAPAAATNLAAAGAALSPDIPEDKATASSSGGFFNSPWTYGLLGVIALAGGAFIFL